LKNGGVFTGAKIGGKYLYSSSELEFWKLDGGDKSIKHFGNGLYILKANKIQRLDKIEPISRYYYDRYSDAYFGYGVSYVNPKKKKKRRKRGNARRYGGRVIDHADADTTTDSTLDFYTPEEQTIEMRNAYSGAVEDITVPETVEMVHSYSGPMESEEITGIGALFAPSTRICGECNTYITVGKMYHIENHIVLCGSCYDKSKKQLCDYCGLPITSTYYIYTNKKKYCKSCFELQKEDKRNENLKETLKNLAEETIPKWCRDCDYIEENMCVYGEIPQPNFKCIVDKDIGLGTCHSRYGRAYTAWENRKGKYEPIEKCYYCGYHFEEHDTVFTNDKNALVCDACEDFISGEERKYSQNQQIYHLGWDGEYDD